MRLSIVIPVWNNWNFTKACLKDLAALPEDHEVVLVDNGSTDKTKELSTYPRDIDDSEFHQNLVVERFKENTGFAHACNHGFAKSLGKYVMFLNNDIRVRDQKDCWTEAILKEAEEGGLVGPTAGMLDSKFNFVCESMKLPTRGFPYISGWNLTAKRQVLIDLQLKEYRGPFTEEFTTYFEDTDLSLRAREMNIPLKVVSSVPVHHFGKVTSKKLDTLKLYLPAKEKFIEKWKTRANDLLLK